MKLTCPSCGHDATVSESAADLDVICPQCQRRFRHGAAETGPPDADRSVVIVCPICGRSHVISESHLGRNIICLSCQVRFRVQQVGERLGDPVGEDEQITVICPACGFSRSTTTAYTGRAVGCPQCRAMFVVRAQATAVQMPAQTVWPLVLALGIALISAGVATSPALSIVGAALFLFGLGGWIHQLLPGRGHIHEPLVEPARRPQQVTERPGTVGQLRPGMAGYRFRLPLHVHPISAGIKGGIVGGLVMPIPALAYGIQSGHGIWFPINLLAGMLLPGVEDLPVAQLEQFSFLYLIVAAIIHAVFSVGFGLLYGVVLPTMPKIPGGPLIWGGLLMPLFWTAASYAVMGVVNPALREHIEWCWFLLSQLVYGLAMAAVVFRTEQVAVQPAGGPATAA